MTTIREAFDAMGYELKDSETVCIVTAIETTRISPGGCRRPRTGENSLFYSTGTFPRGQRFGSGGRTAHQRRSYSRVSV